MNRDVALRIPRSSESALLREKRFKRSLEFARLFSRNKLALIGAIVVISYLLVAIFADYLAPYDPIALNSPERLQAPSLDHPFGTDRFGRDVFSRTIVGSRVSLWVSVSSVLLATLLGTLFGLISGFFGHWTDMTISRVLDVLFSFPGLLLAIGIAAFLGAGTNNAIIAIAIVYTPLIARVVRGSVLAEKEQDYVHAAKMIGAKQPRIVARHVLPNVMSPIIVQSSIILSYAILIEASLSYLGLGSQPPTPSWGTMLNEGRPLLETAPWMSVFPGLAIVVAVFGFNLLGDGIREVLDPRRRGI